MHSVSTATLHDEAQAALDRKDFVAALEAYEKMATLGSTFACCVVGNIYLHGEGDVEADPVKAEQWLERALQSSEPKIVTRAAHKLGAMYQTGSGVARDDSKAFYYLRKLEHSDHPTGLIRLGIMYEDGKGTQKDAAKAMELYRRSAKLGNLWGLALLGRLKVKSGNVPVGLFLWGGAMLQGVFLGIFRPSSPRLWRL